MAGERELVRRRKDTQPPRIRVFDEHRLGETKVGRNTLPILLRHLPAFQEYAEQVAAGASFAEEDLENVKAGHSDLLVRSQGHSRAHLIPETSNEPASPVRPTLSRAGRTSGPC